MACEAESGITLNNYSDNYTASGSNGISCLPTSGSPPVSGFPPSSLDSSGIVSSTAMTAQVDVLLKHYDAAPPKLLNPSENAPVEKFAKNAAKLRAAIKSEYCFYYNRYSFILQQYLMNAASKTTSSTAAKQLPSVIKLNSILNQILQVYQALINTRNTALTSYHTSSDGNLNSLNADLDTVRTRLENQSKILGRTNSAAEIQAAMIDYSIEKNQSSRNLLAIYGFMNLVAAGLVFYLYRSTRSQ